MTDQADQQDKLEWITRRWWFFLIFALLQFVIPPYASKGYKFPEEWSNVIQSALGNATIYKYAGLYPIFKIIPILLIASIIIFHNRFARLFNIYVVISYVIFALGQNISVTKKYGVAICTINLIMFFAVAAFWFWEVFELKNDFTPKKQHIWRYWIVPLAILAFWAPANRGKPDFNLVYLFTNGSGLAFCMMTPVYVGLLSLFYPNVNVATLRVTSLVGLIIGVYNMIANFLIKPSVNWWNGVLHIPLLVISLYGLIISLKRLQPAKKPMSSLSP